MTNQPCGHASAIAMVIVLTAAGCTKGPDPCSETSTVVRSPSERYEAKLTIKTCAWGFGQAAESAELKVTKLGERGWFYVQPIEFDSINKDDACPPPTIEWTGPNELHVFALTSDTSGKLLRRDEDLSVVREYAVRDQKTAPK